MNQSNRMDQPQRTIQEAGTFQGQPQWVRDFYENTVLNGGAASMHLHWRLVSEEMRERYEFPDWAFAVILLHPGQGLLETQATGLLYNQEQFQDFQADLVFQKNVNLRPMISDAMVQLMLTQKPAEIEADMTELLPGRLEEAHPEVELPGKEENQQAGKESEEHEGPEASRYREEMEQQAREANRIIEEFNNAAQRMGIQGFATETHPDPGEETTLESHHAPPRRDSPGRPDHGVLLVEGNPANLKDRDD